jgi:hypothetical protein
LVAALSVGVTFALVRLPVELAQLTGLLSGRLGLVAIHSVFILPYVAIGALILFLFGREPERSARLYFYDLLGAAAGRSIFFVLIGRLGPCSTVIWSSASGRRRGRLGLGALAPRARAAPRDRRALRARALRYAVDAAKGFEVIADDQPGVEHVYSRWTALGRTDIFRFDDPEAAADLANTALRHVRGPDHAAAAIRLHRERLPRRNADLPSDRRGARQVPAHPVRRRDGSAVRAARSPRDVRDRRGRRARSLDGAAPRRAVDLRGGDQPGRVRGSPSGRPAQRIQREPVRTAGHHGGERRRAHVAKTLPSGERDLVVLNGVDTFAGLSSGAYAYAESYLYTREAIEDFLRTLSEDGILDYNRWFFPGLERETLRLFGTAFRALRRLGYDDPWNHVMVIHEPTGGTSWSVNLIRKRAYTPDEIHRVESYVAAVGGSLVFPRPDWMTTEPSENVFAAYARAAVAGNEDVYEAVYPFDISEVTDDRPFFYKYYRLSTLWRYRSRCNTTRGPSRT